MNTNYIPDGFETVSPFFIVENAPGFIDYLEKAFEARQIFAHKDEGRIVYARLKLGTSLIELSEANPPVYGARPMACQLFVADCDATYDKAIEAGSITMEAPKDRPYGLRAGTIADAWGNQWYISTQIENRYSPEFWDSM